VYLHIIPVSRILGFKLVEKTRDERKLRDALDSISVYGGVDCPEMSLSGIQKGLSESRPGSYLYVFTDASAKDYAMVDEIITLAQDKQSQVTKPCYTVFSFFKTLATFY
jgi:hypothetical protein